jgi:hypothetical protein
MYLLRRTAHLRVKEVAVMAGIAAPWVSHIQRAIEQGEVDAVLEQLLERYQLNIYP